MMDKFYYKVHHKQPVPDQKVGPEKQVKQSDSKEILCPEKQVKQSGSKEISLCNINICIMTCDRSPSYLDSTLATLFAAGQEIYSIRGINLIADAVDLSFLRRYVCLCNSSIRVEGLTSKQASYCATVHKRVRFNVGLHRCLQFGLEYGVLVLEDDVLIKPGMLHWMMLALEEMDKDGIKHYILSLNTRGREFVDEPAFRRGEFYTSYPLGSPFYGSQAIFYSPKVAKEFGPYLKKNGIRPDGTTDLGGDELLRSFLCETSLTWNSGAYATVYAQAEHIGEVSTGLGGRDYWNSKSFYVPSFPASVRVKSPI